MIRDVTILILVRLPVKSLLRFKCLSKFWYNFITSPQFVKMHLKHTHTQNNNPIILLRSSSFQILYALSYTGGSASISPHIEAKQIDYPYQSLYSDFQIWGSCNGLLLIYVVTSVNSLCLFNPSMKEFKDVSFYNDHICFDDVATSDDHMVTYGFGFNRTMDEYKVIRLHAINTIDKGFVSRVTVFRGSFCFWRSIRPLPYNYKWPSQVLRPGLHVNGALHWIVNMSSEPQTPCHKIFSFDIANEDYIDVPKPTCIDTVPDPYLCVLRECLSVLINSDEPRERVDVWMMMNYAVEESWTKLITIAQSSFYFFPRVLWLCKNGEVLVEVPRGNAYVYDPKSNKATDISKCAPYYHTVGIYTESLVSIGSHTYTIGPSCRRQKSDQVSICIDALHFDQLLLEL